MAVAFSRLSWLFWRGKEHEPNVLTSSSSLSNATSADLAMSMREQDNTTVTFASVNNRKSKMRSATSRRIKKKWQSREERKIDREFDVVLVPSDGGECFSDSESDASDWSIGWMEPHAPDFLSDDETESSFAVLVPCYGRGRNEVVSHSKNQILGAFTDLSNGYSADSKKFMEQWLSSLHKF